VEGEAGYEQFAKRLNAVIEKYAVKHHHRHNHANAETNSQPSTQENQQ